MNESEKKLWTVDAVNGKRIIVRTTCFGTLRDASIYASGITLLHNALKRRMCAAIIYDASDGRLIPKIAAAIEDGCGKKSCVWLDRIAEERGIGRNELCEFLASNPNY